jgi:hypothetical protein
MTVLRKFTAVLIACCVSAAAIAAEASPAGTWKWPSGRAGGTEQTLKLDYTAGKLTGTLLGGGAGPDTPISDASFKDGVIKFSVTREARGMKVTTKYEGKLEGDAIKGTSERPNVQGGDAPVKRDWNAVRTK